MENSSIQSNNEVELDFHNSLIKFTNDTWDKPETALANAKDLSQVLDILLKQKRELSDEFIGFIAITINTILCSDYKFLYGIQQRSLPIPKRYNRQEIKDAFSILYDILRRIGFERVHQRINGTFFCNDQQYLYICPRRPPKKDYKYTHGRFVLPNDQTPRSFALENIQHVVHDLHDVVSILNLAQNKTISQRDLTTSTQHIIQAEFTGGPHHVYHGPDLICFGPLLSDLKSSDSPAFNPNISCYGCYRFYIPFEYLLNYNVYILGTRQYDKEYCHTIMFTDPKVKSIKLNEELQQINLEQTKIIERTNNGLWQWQCYRWNENEYDQLDFALAFNNLKFDPMIDRIRLDFVDHQDCIRNKYNYAKQKCTNISRKQAMKNFLSKLVEYQVNLSELRLFFDDNIYIELQELNKENNRS